ncbi:hypothetical protein SAMN02799624_03750 [Paenibacillus sp. UNC496MF]|nr:hypothetical protein SAMN02799624_03750 [Paenibacillus sp. UNC496MF]
MSPRDDDDGALRAKHGTGAGRLAGKCGGSRGTWRHAGINKIPALATFYKSDAFEKAYSGLVLA